MSELELALAIVGIGFTCAVAFLLRRKISTLSSNQSAMMEDIRMLIASSEKKDELALDKTAKALQSIKEILLNLND